MPHRDFGTRQTTTDGPKEPPTFTLGGETFTGVLRAPAAALDDLMAGIKMDENGDRIYGAPSLVRYVTAVLREEEELTADEAIAAGHTRDSDGETIDSGSHKVYVPTDDVSRFRTLVRDKRRAVDAKDLGDIAMWLAEVYSGGRPTGRSGR